MLGAAATAAEPEPVAPELLLYMGRWQAEDGRWLDPHAFEEAWLIQALEQAPEPPADEDGDD